MRRQRCYALTPVDMGLLIRWSAVRIRPGEPVKSVTYTTFLTTYRAFIAQAIDPSFAISNPNLGPRFDSALWRRKVADAAA
jgi:hypothetical protein